jgi:hypothetical protein
MKEEPISSQDERAPQRERREEERREAERARSL